MLGTQGLRSHGQSVKNIVSKTALVSALSMLAITAVVSVVTRQQAVSDARILADQTAARYSAEFAKQFQASERSLATLADSFAVLKAQNVSDKKLYDEILKQSLLGNKNWVGLFSVWEQGAIAASETPDSGDSIGRFMPYWQQSQDGSVWLKADKGINSQEALIWYSLPQQTRTAHLVEPYTYEQYSENPGLNSAAAQKQVFITTLAAPILSNGNFQGVVGADISLTNMQTLLQNLQQENSNFAALISHGGVWVAHPNKTKLGLAGNADFSDQVFEKIKAGAESAYADDALGLNYFIKPMNVTGLSEPWAVVIGYTSDDVFAHANKITLITLGLGILASVLVSGFVGWLYSRSLKTMRHAQLAMLSGAEESYLTDADDVSASLSRYVNKSRQLADDVKVSAAALLQQVDRLNELSSGGHSHGQQLHVSSAPIEALHSSISQIANNVGHADQLVVQTGSLSKAGAESAQVVSKEFREITQTMSRVTELLSGLDTRSDQITQIVAIIKGIADQTNLLALNAAIEAARAGEHGRGFAVVADEVRHLATRTAKATVDITEMVSGMRSETQQVVTSMHGTNELVHIGAEKAEHLASCIAEIQTKMQGVLEQMQLINRATQHQSNTTAEMSSWLDVLVKDKEAQEELVAVLQQTLAGINQKSELLQQTINRA